MAIPTVKEMEANYKSNCIPFVYNNKQFYYHPKMCKCHNCIISRNACPDRLAAENYHYVTFHVWGKNLHWFQSMGNQYTREQAANRCIGMAGGAIKSFKLQLTST